MAECLLHSKIPNAFMHGGYCSLRNERCSKEAVTGPSSCLLCVWETRAKRQMCNNTAQPLAVPGFGNLPLYLELPLENRFASGLCDRDHSLNLTRRELHMLLLMECITDQNDWHIKVYDDSAVAHWRRTAFADPLISEATWSWCLEELRDKAREYESTGTVIVFNGVSGVCRWDILVTPDLREQLQLSIEQLRQSLPGGHQNVKNKQIYHLVDPLLYPLIYNKTLVLTKGRLVYLREPFSGCTRGNVAPAFGEEHLEYLKTAFRALRPDSLAEDAKRAIRQVSPFWIHSERNLHRFSKSFQLLPCEVEFSAQSGTDVRIDSYINNNHPEEHRALYDAIEKIISKSIEPWNQILVRGGQSRWPPRIKTWGVQSFLQRDPPLMMYRPWYQGLAPGQPGHGLAPGQQRLPTDRQSVLPRGPLGTQRGPPEPFYPIGQHKLHLDEHPEAGIVYSYRQWKAGHTANAIVPHLRHDYTFAEICDQYRSRGAGGFTRGRLTPGRTSKKRKYESYLCKDCLFSFTPEQGLHECHIKESNHEYYNVSLQESFRKEGLQVIVGVSSIELTQSDPCYAGGDWQYDGTLNEHIVATSTYVYAADNITEARLSFRQETRMDQEDFRRDPFLTDYDELAEVFGVESLPGYRNKYRFPIAHSRQVLGSVSMRRGRLLAWPNTLQTRQEGFKLMDSLRPGHLRYLTISLVDPHYRICSTRNVPPQQCDWWVDAALKSAGLAETGIPPEIVEMIRENLHLQEWPMGRDEAMRLREEILKEREEMEKWAEREQYNQYGFVPLGY